MNFFEHQRQAKKNTNYLVFLFFLAVVGLIIMTNITAWVAFELLRAQGGEGLQPAFEYPAPHQYHHYFGVTLVTLMVIFFSAVLKQMKLGGSGRKIAEYMEGTDALLITEKPGVKRALNVVEEMAIAAGMTPPPLFILQEESAINAFAAGLTPQNSVIALSQGCLDHLTRDELQGVVAHEMSHILNGDTRLNVKLLGYLAGIVTIGVMGKFILRSMGRSSRYRSRNSKGGGGAILLVLFIGVSLWIIGSLGVFVGRMIRSAVSRQREFLADASAAQFTRYPAGIAGALAKIGQQTGTLHAVAAEECSHMCFENPLASYTIYATHPPLEDRIARLDKRFLEPDFLDRQLTQPEKPTVKTEDTKKKKRTPQNIIDSIGDPSPESIATVGVLLSSVLPKFYETRSEALQAEAIALVLLNLSGKSEKAIKLVETYRSEELVQEFKLRAAQLHNLDRNHVLPALHQCIPKLRNLENTEKNIFLKTCEYLVGVDSLIDLNEAVLYLLLEIHLKEDSATPTHNNKKLSQCSDAVSLLLSALCLHGNENSNKAQNVYDESMKLLGLNNKFTLETHQVSIQNFRKSLQCLMQLTPDDKGHLVDVMLTTATTDGEVDANELEFMKATCEYIGAPIPLEQ